MPYSASFWCCAKQTEINRQKDRLTHVKKIFEWQTDRGENEARRQTSTQTDRMISRQTDSDKQTDKHRVTSRQTDKWSDKKTKKETDKPINRQIGRTQKTNSSKISRKGEFLCHWTFCKETYYVYYNFHNSSLVIFFLGLQLIDERFEKVLFLLNSLLTIMIIYILWFKDTNITYKTIMICTH